MKIDRWKTATTVLAALLFGSAQAEMTLADAEALALADDPGLRALEAEARALLETAGAAQALPDPQLKLGAFALPTDTFDLDQEPMTQLQVGLAQQFPPGRTRQLAGRRERERAAALVARSDALRRALRMELRQAWISLLADRQVLALLESARSLLVDLRDVTQDYYATGRARQLDIHRAELEAARMEERVLATAQAVEAGRARLATWLGARTQEPLALDWPVLPAVPGPAPAVDGHPLLAVASQQASVADITAAIAGERYKPGFRLELTYGAREAEAVGGAQLPDLLSAIVLVDLPVFRERRQDRELAAARLRADAARYERSDLERRLSATLEAALHRAERLAQRRELFEQTLLPAAAEARSVALDAYRSAAGDLTDLLRAQLDEFDIRIEALRTRADELAARAEVLYLAGEAR